MCVNSFVSVFIKYFQSIYLCSINTVKMQKKIAVFLLKTAIFINKQITFIFTNLHIEHVLLIHLDGGWLIARFCF